MHAAEHTQCSVPLEHHPPVDRANASDCTHVCESQAQFNSAARKYAMTLKPMDCVDGLSNKAVE